jgi:hypothetical protein
MDEHTHFFTHKDHVHSVTHKHPHNANHRHHGDDWTDRHHIFKPKDCKPDLRVKISSSSDKLFSLRLYPLIFGVNYYY